MTGLNAASIGLRSVGTGSRQTRLQIFWLKNRRPDRWRDVQQLQSDVGHCLLSDRPLSEDEWIAQRTIIEQKRVPDETGPQHTPDSQADTDT